MRRKEEQEMKRISAIGLTLLLASCHPGSDTGALGSVTPLHLAFVIHLEGHPEVTEENHERRTQVVDGISAIFEEHDAAATWEVHDTIDSSVFYDDPYLAEIEARGHAVGVHADLGGDRDDESFTQDEFISALEDMRLSLEWQGVRVRHVSGACSHLDWPSAVADAGYAFYSGGVTYCLESLPPALRPPPLEDCPKPSACHDPFPRALRGRMHPWRPDPDNWTQHDESSDLVILPAMLNELDALGEEHQSEHAEANKPSLDERDVIALLEEVERASLRANPERLNTFIIQWSMGSVIEEELLHLLLENIEPYRADGRVVWSTMPEIYDTYLEWEQGWL
jgi:hypothetical protein